MWWRNNRLFGAKNEDQDGTAVAPYTTTIPTVSAERYHHHQETVPQPDDVYETAYSSSSRYPASPRDNNVNDDYYVDQQQHQELYSRRSRMNRLTQNFQSYGRKRVDRLTTTFQTYGRTPSLFYPSYYIPQNTMNDSLYNLDSDSRSHQYFTSPSTRCKHEGYLDDCECFGNRRRATSKTEQNSQVVIAPPAPVACCPHHNCGAKDQTGMIPVDEKQLPQQQQKQDQRQQQDEEEQQRNDTHNVKNNNNNNDGADPSVATDDSTVVPMFDTKAEAEERAAMHRGRLYEMLRRQPHNWFPLFSYLSALGMAVALVVSFIHNRQLTGSVIEISPFNVMLGPSTQVLVYEGARYSPCMRSTDLTNFACPDTKSDGGLSPPSMILSLETSANANCDIQDVCGMASFGDGDPNQWYRVITATFVHSGILHYFCNMLVHLGLGRRVERRLNPLRYGLVWLISGIFGFVASTTFSPVSSASMGCSGSLFGIAALLLIDLMRSWRLIADPGWQLTKLITLMALALVYGYLPGPDNFAHIGGFISGLLVGLVVMPATKPNYSKARIIFKWIMRVVIVVLLGVASFLLLNTFYKGEKPEVLFSWCKYLACLPIGDMCNVYNV